ncbi:papain-like cysteine protease family protein [Azospirillum oryzae]|uniref:papain-like cysteine protease family protein n=1 Tax=Azospirillum oryzae TaxID=286727 RepID=UPI003CCCC42A
MAQQAKSKWCWSAVAEGIGYYYNVSSKWSQCDIVNGELGRSDCCSPGNDKVCNTSGRLGTALARIGHLVRLQAGPTAFVDVRSEISAGQPLGVRVAWQGGNAHFIAVQGYFIDGAGNEWLDLVDPDPMVIVTTERFNDVANRYRGSGSWTTSYFTARAPIASGSNPPGPTGSGAPDLPAP